MYEELSPPAVEPVTLAEAKLHCRQSASAGAAEDSWFTMAIEAARQACEKYCNRPFVPRPIRIYTNSVNTDLRYIELGIGYVQSIIQFRYRDSDGNFQTMSSSNYRLMKSHQKPKILLEWNSVWPTVRDELDSVQIDVWAGFPSEESPDGADGVPAAIKQAMLMMIADLYENREEKIVGTISVENQTVKTLLHFYRVEIMS